MKGEDGQLHTLEYDAASLFDAADKAIYDWHRLWWFTSDADLEIKSGGEQWRVSQERLRESRPNWPKSDRRRPL
jgi:hypothetical protein